MVTFQLVNLAAHNFEALLGRAAKTLLTRHIQPEFVMGPVRESGSSSRRGENGKVFSSLSSFVEGLFWAWGGHALAMMPQMTTASR